ncbi:hypothetical protein D9Q98_005429 [Chlorella vulgaris]|uniref:Fibronectin type-III domain-containing protein n=1 Tax=Chlorella vulgaris TaxID=3077 RepID=A0A9D4TLT1_CHLVU|nr:hypothetical protein D9Q98_005429 [Chlorella vulgaris]
MSPRCVVLGVVAVLLWCGSLANAQALFGRINCPKPKSLSFKATSSSSVAFSWQPGEGSSSACTSSYLISVFKTGQPSSSAKSFATSVPGANINGLSPSDSYTVQVRVLSRAGLAGSDPATLSSVATVASPQPTLFAAEGGIGGEGWACVAAEGYPVCSAGQAGLCAPITCDDMARLGRCGAPYIRVQDWAKRTVTQYCASQCAGCAGKAAPRLADSLSPVKEYCCAFEAGAYFAGPKGEAVTA